MISKVKKRKPGNTKPGKSKPGNAARETPPTHVSQNGHGGGTADSPTEQTEEQGPAQMPEIGGNGYQNTEIGGNSARNEEARVTGARDEFGRLRLREGQACIGSKLDNAMEAKVCGYIASGLSLLDSCRICDLDAATVYRWRKKGEEQPGSRYALFLERVLKAESCCKGMLVTRCARDPDWKSAAWLLRVKWPLEFTEHIRQELSGPQGAPLALGNQFQVIFQTPPATEGDFSVVDHSQPKAVEDHVPSTPEQDPFSHTPNKVVQIDRYDPLSAKAIGSGFIKPKKHW
jgi:hypothetical protein